MFRLTALSIILSLFWYSVSSSGLENNGTDYAALMAFKSHLTLETDSILSTNWTSTTHYCNWFGVSCLNQRVTNLELTGLALWGELPPQLANMTHLVVLDLSRNELGGTLPTELGVLRQLRVLNVSRNSLHGGIPYDLSTCQRLQKLDLSSNFLSGTIPHELGYLGNLQELALHQNNLTSNIPASFGNFSKLEHFYLHENDLVGTIPSELGKLTRLTHLRISGNNLTGTIPPSIFNISTLQIVDLYMNQLSGQLPENLGERTPNLEFLLLDSNRITGKIPTFLSNASKLTNLYLSDNDLHGEIPNDFSKLRALRGFAIQNNRISGWVPQRLFNISSLQVLTIRQNNLTGELPHDFGNWLPNLRYLSLSHNQFSGPIPTSICNATKLTNLEVGYNSFSGPVPMMLGNLAQLEFFSIENNSLTNNPNSTHLDFLNSLVNCRNLRYLILADNPLNGILPESVGNLSSNLNLFIAKSCELKGGIPYAFGNLSSLNILALLSNNLQGGIPSTFSGMQNLERLYLGSNKLEGSIPTVLCSINILGTLDLGENNFSGPIPTCIQNLTQLRQISITANNVNSTVPLGFWNLENIHEVDFSRNLIHGSIPTEVGNLRALVNMDLSSNEFSGEIPDAIGSLQNLLLLDVSKNRFQGQIPNTLSNLIVVEYLDLSSNGFSGDIPSSLESLRDLQYLNLSFNRLQGEIPSAGVFTNLTYQSLMGNPNLCGAPNLNFSLCSPPPQSPAKRKQRTSLLLKITIPIGATSLLLIAIILLWIKFPRKKQKNATEKDNTHSVGHKIITYHELQRATENFSPTNLVGQGSSGMVFKGQLFDGTVAAIKVFNIQYAKALKNFDAECEVLSTVKHRNLVKVISTCSNVEFKAMVLEFMPNGSLDMWLHSENIFLTLVERLNIMTDVALAMEYLHHECVVPILHCDLKPANVLLDEDLTAHVADFGISKILAQDQEFIQTMTLGTIGYIAPEYGLDGHASMKGDVYSFGVLLLETFTGKRPTDEMFKEDLSLLKWVYRVFPDALIEVLDSNLSSDTNAFEEGRPPATVNGKQKHVEELLVSIIQVALCCLKELPEERIDMRSVAIQLKKIRAALKLNNKTTNNTRRLT